MNVMDEINKWIKEAKKYEDDINFKELSKLSGKEIVKKISIKAHRVPELKDKCYIIKKRVPTYHTANYYSDPKMYFKDLFSLIYAIKDVLNKTTNVDWVDFKLPNDDEVYQVSLIHFTFNMILWMPFFILDIDLDKSKIFMEKEFTNKTYVKYVNEKIISYKYLTTHNEMSLILSKMYDLFIIISERYSLNLGNTFSMYDLISKWDTNKEIYDINHTQIPDNMQVHDAEIYINQRTERYKEILLNDPKNNVLKPFIKSGQGVNTKQLREFAVSIGFTPDPDGHTYAVIPKSSFITDGIRDGLAYTINSTGGRYAGILALEIDVSGYLQRTFCKSSSNLFLDPDETYDCGTKHYYEKEITDLSDLKSMRGRWYLSEDGTMLNQLLDTDMNMIGKKLKFRSPATCASHMHGRGICKYCYGHLYNQNKNINIGINAALKITERNYQNTMSVKHILDTTTKMFGFNYEFYDYFIIENSSIVRLRDDLEVPENFILRINVNEIQRVEQIDDLLNNEYIKGFEIYDIDEEKTIRIDEINDNKVFISDFLLNQIFKKRSSKEYDENGWMEFNLADIPADEDVFFTQLKNKEVTASLKEAKRMIERGKEIEGVSSISELITKIYNLFKSGNVNVESVHMEVLMRNLIRDKHNIIKLPNYLDDNIEYSLTSIHNSILMSNSIITSLTFERLAQQFRDPLTFNKNGTSPLDRLFIRD